MGKQPGRYRNISINYVNGNHPITYIRVSLRSATPPPSPQESQWTSIRKSQPLFVLKTYQNLLLRNTKDALGRSCVTGADNPGITPLIAPVKLPPPRQRKPPARIRKE